VNIFERCETIYSLR